MVPMSHSREAAEMILDPYMDLLGGVFPAAWGRWEDFGETMPDLRLICCKRTRASMISDLAVTEARTVFAGKSPAVALHDGRKFLLIEIDSQLCLRLNKFRDGSRETSGISTYQRRAFDAQEPLTGMPEATNLVLGYELNGDETEMACAAITCRTDGRLNWEIEVPLPGETVAFNAPAPGPDVPRPQITSARLDRKKVEESGA
jgi:hypothetical protein